MLLAMLYFFLWLLVSTLWVASFKLFECFVCMNLFLLVKNAFYFYLMTHVISSFGKIIGPLHYRNLQCLLGAGDHYRNSPDAL